MKTTIVMTLIMVFICSVAAARDYWSESKTKESTVIAGKTEYRYVQKGVKYGKNPLDVWKADKKAAELVIFTWCRSPVIDTETGTYPYSRMSMRQWLRWKKPKQTVFAGRLWHSDIIMLGEPYPAMPTDAEIKVYLEK